MQIGERVQVRAHKSDGLCYRWWYATVEAVERDKIVLVTPVGHRVHDIGGAWASECAIRAFYWFERWYSLLEVYAYDGRLDEIYVNISSPVEIVAYHPRMALGREGPLGFYSVHLLPNAPG